MDENDIDIEKHMKHFATQRFPFGSMNDERLHAREYIKDTFRQIGLRVVEHRFNTSINPDLTGTSYDEEIVSDIFIFLCPVLCSFFLLCIGFLWRVSLKS